MQSSAGREIADVLDAGRNLADVFDAGGNLAIPIHFGSQSDLWSAFQKLHGMRTFSMPIYRVILRGFWYGKF